MKITTSNQCVYGSQIRQFVIQQFPRIAKNVDRGDLIEILTNLTLGTSHQRQGPNPKPEGVVAIRDVLRDAVSRNAPLPFMAPWGAVKPDGSSVDVAELMALRTFEHFHKEVLEVYRPGIQVAVRLEDISMPYFQFPGGPDLAAELERAAAYTWDFTNLVKILGLQNVILVRAESSLTTVEEFASVADPFIPAMEAALAAYEAGKGEEAEGQLDEIGWKGGIPFEMREHYLSLYRNLHPGEPDVSHYRRMARYFASACARNPMKLRGDLREWDGKFIDWALAQPVPGTGSLFGRRVHRRAVTSRIAGRHVAPWRAKGYLVIGDDNRACVKLRSFREAPEDLHKETVRLTDESSALTVDVRADWTCG